MTLKEFDQGMHKIMVDTFKLRWMEHFVDVLRSLNNLTRLFLKFFDGELREKIS